MTSLLVLLSIIALVCAIGAARQTTRTLRAWQAALEALRTELTPRSSYQEAPMPLDSTPMSDSGLPEGRFKSADATGKASNCPCTCHPMPTRKS
jgi:hypothetical protein